MRERKNPLGPTGETVRHNVRRLRERCGLSYAELSRRLEDAGRPIATLGLSRIEAGERRVDADDLVALAVVLDATPATLLLPDNGGGDAEEATAAGEATGADLWAWAERWAPLPSQRPELLQVPEGLTGVARGRAAYRADPRAAASLWREGAGPQDVGSGDHEFLAELREALDGLPPDVRLRVWSDDGRWVAEYPGPEVTYRHREEPIDRDGQRWAELRDHLVAILNSDAVRPLVPAILERIQLPGR